MPALKELICMTDDLATPQAYYTKHSFMTNPGGWKTLYADLPRDVPGLVKIIQGLLIHPLCVDMYHVKLSVSQREEQFLRSMAQMLERISEIDDSTLTVPRDPMHRLVGNCRDHAVFLISMLRHQGIPARLRVGFASYLAPNKNEDHWITEYWHAQQKRWILVDPHA